MHYTEFPVHLSRIYDERAPSQRIRVRVDRLGRIGVTSEVAHVDRWLGGIAPSPGLRKWLDHEPTRWDEFLDRSFVELDDNPQAVTELFQKATASPITLLFAAKDERHNHAAALKLYLEGDS